MSDQVAVHSPLLIPSFIGEHQSLFRDLSSLILGHQAKFDPQFRVNAMILLHSVNNGTLTPREIDRLEMSMKFLSMNLNPSPFNAWLHLCPKRRHLHHPGMRTRVYCRLPHMISGLIKRFFGGLKSHHCDQVKHIISLILRHVSSRQIHMSLDKAAKTCLDAVACDKASTESLWEFVTMGHVPTIRDLIWALINGRIGISENITTAIYLATMFPHAPTQGARLLMSEWSHDIQSCWSSVQEHCQKGRAQSLYVTSENLLRFEDTYEEETEMDLAFRCLTQAADAGLADAQYSLAQRLWWKERAFDKCCALLTNAAKQGHEMSYDVLIRRKQIEKILPFP